MNNSTTAGNVARTMLDLPPLAAQSLHKNADHMMQLIGFHSLYDVPMAPLQNDDPEFSHMSDERVSLRLGLISEEFAELFEKGFGVNVDIHYTVRAGGGETGFNDHAMKTGKVLAHTRRAHGAAAIRNGTEVADALGDLIYVIYGFALELGYDLRAVVEEIHASNLTKLGEDGKPILREDGKVLKGPNYREPNIPAVLGFDG